MSSSFSETRQRALACAGVIGVAAATVVFHAVQNRLSLTGGAIAWPKSVWLGCAVLYWFVLPALLISDARLPPAWRKPFAALLVLMALRGVVELWMLYVTHNWSPSYGIVHDALCLVVLWWLAWRAAGGATALRHAGLPRVVFIHALVTASLFIPEIYFAWYMRATFNTQGANPIYFVPNDPAYTRVLALTTAADAAALLYLPGFLYAWLHGKADVARA